MFQRRKTTLWFLMLAAMLCIAGVAALSLQSGLVQSPTPTPDVPIQDLTDPIPLYTLVEIPFALSSDDTDNPYNPDEIAVNVTFRAPSGSQSVVPAFYARPFRDTCVMNCSAEVLAPAGDPGWAVRFAPDQVGVWTYRIEARRNSEVSIVQQGIFQAVQSDDPGFVRVGSGSRYFAFDNDTAYFPIGENLAWSWPAGGGIYAYERWLDSLSAAGANYARLNIDIPWFIGLDWPGPAGDYDAAQKSAWRLDRILEMAEARGIYLQMTLIWYRSFAQYSAPPESLPAEGTMPDTSADWDSSPYNVTNGGPLSDPAAVFTDPEAAALLRQRLRYIVARWGYSPHVFAWEAVDQIDGMTSVGNAGPWLKDLVAYLHQIDPYDHLITAGARQADTAVWTLAALDFAQVSLYPGDPAHQPVDQAGDVLIAASQALAGTQGPVLLTEFSLNPWVEPTEDDPTGVHIRNTIWVTALSGAAGGAMPWWWDSYIDRGQLYSLFTPLALFTRDIPWNSAHLEPIQAGLVAANPVIYDIVRFDDFDRTFPGNSPPDTIYRLTADGAFPSTRQLSAYLYGAFNPERGRPQSFFVSPPVDTELRLLVQSVSSTAPAVLTITIDGAEAARVDFSPDSENILITLPISAGEHLVVLDNPGNDWLQLGYIELAHYRAPVRALALADRTLGMAIAWVQHRDYTWQRVAQGAAVEPLTFNLRLTGMPLGNYRVTFWDTATGNVIGEENLTLDVDSGGTMQIDLLPVSSQLAVRAFRVAGPEGQPTPEASRYATRTPQVTLTPTLTGTVQPTVTDTATATPTATDTATATATHTPTVTNTTTATSTATDTATATATHTPTATNTSTATPTATDTATATPTATDTATPTATSTATATDTATATRTPFPTRTPSRTPTITRTPRVTLPPSPTERIVPLPTEEE